MREHSRENLGREDAAEGRIEGRNAVAEAIRSGVSIDKLYIAKGETDRTLARLAADAKRTGAVVSLPPRESGVARLRNPGPPWPRRVRIHPPRKDSG